MSGTAPVRQSSPTFRAPVRKRTAAGRVPGITPLRREEPVDLLGDGQGGGEARRVDPDEAHEAGQAARRLLRDHEVAEALAGALQLRRGCRRCRA